MIHSSRCSSQNVPSVANTFFTVCTLKDYLTVPHAKMEILTDFTKAL